MEGHHLALPRPPSEMVLRAITLPLLPVRAGTLGEVGWACESWDEARPVLALLPSVGFDLGGGKPDVLSLSSHRCGEVQPDRALPFRKDPLVCRA